MGNNSNERSSYLRFSSLFDIPAMFLQQIDGMVMSANIFPQTRSLNLLPRLGTRDHTSPDRRCPIRLGDLLEGLDSILLRRRVNWRHDESVRSGDKKKLKQQF